MINTGPYFPIVEATSLSPRWEGSGVLEEQPCLSRSKTKGLLPLGVDATKVLGMQPSPGRPLLLNCFVVEAAWPSATGPRRDGAGDTVPPQLHPHRVGTRLSISS